jgi:hypothetical protein
MVSDVVKSLKGGCRHVYSSTLACALSGDVISLTSIFASLCTLYFNVCNTCTVLKMMSVCLQDIVLTAEFIMAYNKIDEYM